MFILFYYFGCKITKKSANRTYTIYGFIYPFYGFSLRRLMVVAAGLVVVTAG